MRQNHLGYLALPFAGVLAERRPELRGNANAHGLKLFEALLGLRANLADMALGADLSLSPRLDLGWQHALAGVAPYQTVSYANAGTSFEVLGTPLAADAATLQAGFDLKVGASTMLSLSYDGSFSPTVENHAFRGSLSWHF